MTNDIRDSLQETARAIEARLPPHTGFFLLAFDFGDKPGRMEYTSNARREDVLKLMLEFIEKSVDDPERWMKHAEEPPDLTRGAQG